MTGPDARPGSARTSGRGHRPRPARIGAWLLVTALLLAGCEALAPTRGPSPSALGPSPSASLAPASGPPPSPPTPAAFWQAASRALTTTGRLRLIVVGAQPNEYRYEVRASAALAEGVLVTVCVDGRAYAIDGFTATPRPARWTCGSGALISGFRRTGRPHEAWNASIPTDRGARETIVAEGRDQWRWEYTATSDALAGPIRATLLMDARTGRLVSGTRSDPTGSVRYTFNYTALFLPVQLP